jgi:membrane protein DedA with SNARE-associated domain
MFIIFGRFLPGIGNLTPYIAGFSSIKPGLFLIYNTVFITCWGLLYLGVGFLFGRNYQAIAESLNNKLIVAGLVVVGGYLLYALVMKQRNSRQ